jgi:hypothetical protein
MCDYIKFKGGPCGKTFTEHAEERLDVLGWPMVQAGVIEAEDAFLIELLQFGDCLG